MNNMNGYKIVICGGGSTYTAGIVKDLIDQKDELGIRELWLYDIDKERQDTSLWWLRQLSMTLPPRSPCM